MPSRSHTIASMYECKCHIFFSTDLLVQRQVSVRLFWPKLRRLKFRVCHATTHASNWRFVFGVQMAMVSWRVTPMAFCWTTILGHVTWDMSVDRKTQHIYQQEWSGWWFHIPKSWAILWFFFVSKRQQIHRHSPARSSFLAWVAGICFLCLGGLGEPFCATTAKPIKPWGNGASDD